MVKFAPKETLGNASIFRFNNNKSNLPGWNLPFHPGFLCLSLWSTMFLYLDDIRDPPDFGWTIVRTARQAIDLLKTNQVKVISLDHDLGENIESGYDVIKFIEEQAYINKEFNIPIIHIHTDNPVGRKNMELVLNSINRAKNDK